MQISAPALAHIAQHILVVPPQATLEGLTVSQGSNATVWMLRSEIVGPSEAPPFSKSAASCCVRRAFERGTSRLQGHAVCEFLIYEPVRDCLLLGERQSLSFQIDYCNA